MPEYPRGAEWRKWDLHIHSTYSSEPRAKLPIQEIFKSASVNEIAVISKGVELLSPGERSQLLLIFYLLIDRKSIPLIIDQPEENLDNQSVYKVLVPCIKEAKEKRQVILVTHNPNLAVVCDAEQIICVKMNKKNNNTITYITGAIENPVINRKIVEILEGTEPAFTIRKSKYQFAGKQEQP